MRERNLAEYILKHYKMEDSIDLKKIISIQGIGFKIFENNEDARTWYNSNNIIYINETLSKQLQNFAIAHSMGHYFLKHDDCPKDTYEQMCSSDYRERSANLFAYEILMPKKRVEKYLDEGLSQVEMSNRFHVLNETMGKRLISLGDEYDREYVFLEKNIFI